MSNGKRKDDQRQPARARERHEPEELHNPVPLTLLVLFVGLIGWGVWYYFATPSAPMNAGDTRTPVVASAGGDADGATVYAGNCASCHQANGKGLSGAFPPLVGSRWVTTAKTEVPIQILLHGINGTIEVAGDTYSGVMPAFDQFSDEEIAAVLSYIRSSWGNAASDIAVEDVVSNREATAERDAPWNGGQELEATYGEP